MTTSLAIGTTCEVAAAASPSDPFSSRYPSSDDVMGRSKALGYALRGFVLFNLVLNLREFFLGQRVIP